MFRLFNSEVTSYHGYGIADDRQIPGLWEFWMPKLFPKLSVSWASQGLGNLVENREAQYPTQFGQFVEVEAGGVAGSG